MKVCVLHTDFGEFNSNAATEYFDHTGITWEPSAPYAQQQNGVVERYMRTIVEGARAQMVDANLPLKLWAESINTMIYIKNRSPTSAVYEGTITLIQDFHCGELPHIDHIRIFGSETYMFHESTTRPGMTPKTWTGYFVRYGGRNQYRIYDLVRHSVFLRRNVEINEQVVGPPKPTITTDNSFENTDQNSFVFPSLFYVTEESTRFTLASATNTYIPIQSMQSSSSRLNNQETISLRLPALKDGTASAETVDSNCTAKTVPTEPAPHPETLAVVPASTPMPDRN